MLHCVYRSDYSYIFLVATVGQSGIRDIWSEPDRYLIFEDYFKSDIGA